jgi:hypothetical protein
VGVVEEVTFYTSRVRKSGRNEDSPRQGRFPDTKPKLDVEAL